MSEVRLFACARVRKYICACTWRQDKRERFKWQKWERLKWQKWTRSEKLATRHRLKQSQAKWNRAWDRETEQLDCSREGLSFVAATSALCKRHLAAALLYSFPSCPCYFPRWSRCLMCFDLWAMRTQLLATSSCVPCAYDQARWLALRRVLFYCALALWKCRIHFVSPVTRVKSLCITCYVYTLYHLLRYTHWRSLLIFPLVFQ